MSQVLIIGYGNTLRQDDGAGAIAISRLTRSFKGGQPVETISCRQLTPEMASRLVRQRAVIFIDTSLEGEPGTVTCRRIGPQDEMSYQSAHIMNPESLLFIAKQLYGASPKAWLLTVTGERFGHGEGLSESVTSALNTLVRQAVRISERELEMDDVDNESE